MISSASSVLPPARRGVDVQRLPLRPLRTADAEPRQQPPLRQHVDRRALLGQQHRIAQRQRHHVDAELDPPRAPGDRRQRRHALQDRLAADDAVGLPDRIDAARLAQIDPAPEPVGAGERKLHQAQRRRRCCVPHCLQASFRSAAPHPPSVVAHRLAQRHADLPVQHQIGVSDRARSARGSGSPAAPRCAPPAPGKPAAGYTTSDEPMAMNRSDASVSSSARIIAAGGIDWPNEIVAVFT